MITPIDFGRLTVALSTSRGIAELALTLSCVAAGWLIDRRIEQAREARGEQARLPGSFVRLAFPLVALALTYGASVAWGRFVGPPLFLAIATPVLLALAVIRMVAYGLRRLFPSQAWLPAWEKS